MKSKTKVFSIAALGLLVVLGLSLYASGGLDSLQGKFSTASSALGTVNYALSTSSPSGSRTVSSSDDVLVMTASTTRSASIPAGSTFTVYFWTTIPAYIDAAADGSTVYLKNGSTTIGTGVVDRTDLGTAYATVTTTSRVSLTRTMPATLTVNIDSATVLDETPGEDDPFNVAFKYGSTWTEMVEGNVLNY
ncbi:MAG: hypothetical protein WC777_02235 [Candidatus Gracilibacteria bacterium]|jgi:hypothetical protein